MITAYLGYFALMILLSCIISAEMATYCTRRERLLQLEKDGHGAARLALLYLRVPKTYLAGTQIAATLVTLVTGVMVEPLFIDPAKEWLSSTGISPDYVGSLAYWLVILGLTMLTTIFINLLPKRFALAHAESVAMFFARPAYAWIKGTGTLLKAMNAIVDKIGVWLRLRETADSDVTERDIEVLLREGLKDGLINDQELHIALNALRMSDIKASTLMTPKPNIVSLNRADPGWIAAARDLGHSLVPVHEGDLDEAQSYVRIRELLAGGSTCAVYPLLRVPVTSSALDVLAHMTQAKSRLALVVGDHGRVTGLLSLRDLEVALLGQMLPRIEAH